MWAFLGTCKECMMLGIKKRPQVNPDWLNPWTLYAYSIGGHSGLGALWLRAVSDSDGSTAKGVFQDQGRVSDPFPIESSLHFGGSGKSMGRILRKLRVGIRRNAKLDFQKSFSYGSCLLQWGILGIVLASTGWQSGFFTTLLQSYTAKCGKTCNVPTLPARKRLWSLRMSL